jgi:hypothetical protein
MKAARKFRMIAVPVMPCPLLALPAPEPVSEQPEGKEDTGEANDVEDEEKEEEKKEEEGDRAEDSSENSESDSDDGSKNTGDSKNNEKSDSSSDTNSESAGGKDRGSNRINTTVRKQTTQVTRQNNHAIQRNFWKVERLQKQVNELEDALALAQKMQDEWVTKDALLNGILEENTLLRHNKETTSANK